MNPIVLLLGLAGLGLIVASGGKKKKKNGKRPKGQMGPPAPADFGGGQSGGGGAGNDIKRKGVNAQLAKQLAQLVYQDIQAKMGNYDQKLLMKFQTAAGIQVDGIYGPETRAALRKYGIINPPLVLRKFEDVLNTGRV